MFVLPGDHHFNIFSVSDRWLLIIITIIIIIVFSMLQAVQQRHHQLDDVRQFRQVTVSLHSCSQCVALFDEVQQKC